jgi:FkbM family methyltransferase
LSILFEDRLKLFIPAALYYRHKIAKESRRREPELARLRDIVPARGTAIDVGANRGIYSYALSKVVDRVEAFEPNPFLARFMRRKLGSRVRVHELALSGFEGRAKFYVPQDERGVDIHIMGHLKAGDREVRPEELSTEVESEVRVARLDSFAFDDVVFVKIDAEGSDMAVIEGARQTLARHRPVMLIELLAGHHEGLETKLDGIERAFGYAARILVDGHWLPARQVLRREELAPLTHNVLFVPER